MAPRVVLNDEKGIVSLGKEQERGGRGGTTSDAESLLRGVAVRHIRVSGCTEKDRLPKRKIVVFLKHSFMVKWPPYIRNIGSCNPMGFASAGQFVRPFVRKEPQ